MDANQETGAAMASVAAAIGDPGRARMLCALIDGVPRTSTELALAADLPPSSASGHLARLRREGLVAVEARGRHRYYSLCGRDVAQVLEALTVVAGAPRHATRSTTPVGMRAARSCYDHLAGRLGVALHDALMHRRWVDAARDQERAAYQLTESGATALARLGVDVGFARVLRRRFAYPCLDWSERRPHVGGALGAALLDLSLRKRWVTRQRETRALTVTLLGERELRAAFGLVWATD